MIYPYGKLQPFTVILPNVELCLKNILTAVFTGLVCSISGIFKDIVVKHTEDDDEEEEVCFDYTVDYGYFSIEVC